MKLALQYAIKLKANKCNPAYSSVVHLQCPDLYEARPKYISPFGIRIKSHLENMGVNLNRLAQTHLCPIPPWNIQKLNIICNLAQQKMNLSHPNEYKQEFVGIKCSLPLHRPVYADGSKTENGVSAAAVFGQNIFSIRITSESSVFTAEACALLLALEQ